MSGDILAAREVERQYRKYNLVETVDEIYFDYPSEESEFLTYCEMDDWLIKIHKLVREISEYIPKYREDMSQEMLAKGFSFPETVNKTLLSDLESFYQRWENLKDPDIFPESLSQYNINVGNELIDRIESNFQRLLQYQLWRISLEYNFQQMRYSLSYIEDNYHSFIRQLVVSTQFSRFVTDSASLLEDLGEMYLEVSDSDTTSVSGLYDLINKLKEEDLLILDVIGQIDNELKMELTEMFGKLDRFRDEVRNKYAHSIGERKDIDHKEVIAIFPYIFACLETLEGELLMILYKRYVDLFSFFFRDIDFDLN